VVDFLPQAHALAEYTRHLRRDFHQHPELGFQEVRTAGIVAAELRDLGLEVSTGIGRTGVVALIEGVRPGPTILLRFDMDALPIQETTGAPYASQTPGIMHACGHDGHTAIGLTVARLLNTARDEFAGSFKLVFQPAEEGLGGAPAMIADGVLADPHPARALALHLWNDKPVGWLGISPGPVMAASEVFTIRLQGRGGHGAMPQQTVDPVVAAAAIITALQTIVARNVSPLDSAVVSVTAVLSGQAHNVIPDQAELRGTLRSFQPEVRAALLERLEAIVQHTAAAFGCEAVLELRPISLAVVNDPATTTSVQQSATALFPDAALDTAFRTMGSEDMSYILTEIPGCFVFVGSADTSRGLNASLHHPRFDFDEAVLPRAAALMSHAALNLISTLPPP
jgi:amidohydrolase